MAREITTFPNVITQNGWTKTEQCNCSGIKKVKFQNVNYPNYVLEWWVDYYSFRMLKSNKTIQIQTKLAYLGDYLKSLKYEQAAIKADTPSPKTAAKKVEVAPVVEDVKETPKTEPSVEPEPAATTDKAKTSTKTAKK